MVNEVSRTKATSITHQSSRTKATSITHQSSRTKAHAPKRRVSRTKAHAPKRRVSRTKAHAPKRMEYSRLFSRGRVFRENIREKPQVRTGPHRENDPADFSPPIRLPLMRNTLYITYSQSHYPTNGVVYLRLVLQRFSGPEEVFHRMSICCVCGKTEKHLKRAKPRGVRLFQTLPAAGLQPCTFSLVWPGTPGAVVSTCSVTTAATRTKTEQEAVMEVVRLKSSSLGQACMVFRCACRW